MMTRVTNSQEIELFLHEKTPTLLAGNVQWELFEVRRKTLLDTSSRQCKLHQVKILKCLLNSSKKAPTQGEKLDFSGRPM